MSDFTEARLGRLEERLAKIETHLGLSAPPQTTSPIPKTSAADLSAWADDEPVQSFAPQTSNIASTIPADAEDDKPMNWLGFTALICFVLAAGLIIKLSIDSGWLTPTRQIGISALLGTSLIGAGLWFMKLDRKYASLLPSAGIIILYLTSFAAHLYYDLISSDTALVLTSMVSAVSIGLFHKIRHDVYVVTAAIGAYLSPIIFDMNVLSDFTLYYFLLCSVSFAILSIFLQSRLLILVPANLAILGTAIIGLRIHNDALIATCLGLNFFIFSVGTYLYSKHHQKPLTETEAWSFLPVLVVFYAAEYFYIHNINAALAPWISLGFSGVLLGLYLSARALFPNGLGSQNLILSFVTLVCFHSVYIVLLPDDFKPWLLVLITLGAAFIPTPSLQQKYKDLFIVPLLAIGVIVAIEYVSIVSHLFHDRGSSWVLASLASVASIWTLLIAKSAILRTKSDTYYGLLASAHVLAILGLYRLANEAGSLAVSASWLLYAVIVMVLFATPRKDAVMAKSALMVLAFAAGKALLYDASNAPTLIRIFCLLLTGAVLYGCGFLMRRVASWKSTSE